MKVFITPCILIRAEQNTQDWLLGAFRPEVASRVEGPFSSH